MVIRYQYPFLFGDSRKPMKPVKKSFEKVMVKHIPNTTNGNSSPFNFLPNFLTPQYGATTPEQAKRPLKNMRTKACESC